MAEKTVTRADLSEAVYQEVGLSRNESTLLVESVLSEIADTLARGETVKLSSFGSFSVRQKAQRIGRNPKTGEEVPILPRKVLIFRASNVLKNLINRGQSPVGSKENETDGSPSGSSNAETSGSIIGAGFSSNGLGS